MLGFSERRSVNRPAAGSQEVRASRGELRATGAGDKQYLEGRAASYNVETDLGWWVERIMPGAFARALKERQDVRHLINHDANLVLGRSKSGTLELSEKADGLYFRTSVPDTSYAKDLATSVSRGDIDECSFAFIAVRTVWIEEPNPADAKQQRYVRELHDVDLFDISTVTYPAYQNTVTELSGRSIPADAPAELRSRIGRKPARRDEAKCECQCAECLDGDCAECTDPDCQDENCRCSNDRAAARKAKGDGRLRLAEAQQ